MADKVSVWKSGQEVTALGTATVGYPHADFEWNTDSDDTDSHAALTSEAFAYPGRYFTLVMNATADTIGGSADVVYTLYGSNGNPGTDESDLAIAKWDTVKTATIGTATITDLVTFVEINTENDEGFFRYYKLKLDPSADVAADCLIRVGINSPPKAG